MNKDQIAEANSGVGAAIVAGAALAGVIKNPHPDGDSAVIVPEGMKLEYLKRPEFPAAKDVTVLLADVASFLLYFKTHQVEASTIYGSMAPAAQFIAVLNEHTKDKADWRKHRAKLTLAHSVEWMEWTKRDKQPFDGNEAFAIWLENNLIDVVAPEPARLLEILLNMRVNQQQGLTSTVKLDNGALNFEYTNDVTANAVVNAKKVAIPEQFTISVPVFSGLDSPKYKVEARFRYKMAGGNLQLRYELVRPHKVIESAFKDILARVVKETKREVLFGTPE